MFAPVDEQRCVARPSPRDLDTDFPSDFETWIRSYLSGIGVSNVALAAPSRTGAAHERMVARLETQPPEDGHVFHFYVATHLPGRLEIVGILASNADLFEEVQAAFDPFLESLRYSWGSLGQASSPTPTC